MYEVLVSHTEASMLLLNKIVSNKALKEIKNKEESSSKKEILKNLLHLRWENYFIHSPLK